MLRHGDPNSDSDGWLLENGLMETARINLNIIKNLGKNNQIDTANNGDPNINVPSTSTAHYGPDNVPPKQTSEATWPRNWNQCWSVLKTLPSVYAFFNFLNYLTCNKSILYDANNKNIITPQQCVQQNTSVCNCTVICLQDIFTVASILLLFCLFFCGTCENSHLFVCFLVAGLQWHGLKLQPVILTCRFKSLKPGPSHLVSFFFI